MQVGISDIFGENGSDDVQIYNKVLLDSIEREKAGIDYLCDDTDKKLLQVLFEEINKQAGTEFQYLAELDAINVPGAGRLVARYIQNFASESVKSYLLPQMIADKVENCDELILKLYMHFRTSREYISEPGVPAPAHIYVRYDNALRSLKPKRLCDELIRLAYYPRDAFYLPLTMKMLASWRVPELEDIFVLYASGNNVSEQDVGLMNNGEMYCPTISFIKRELRFTGIDCLKYYPTNRALKIAQEYTKDKDPDIRFMAKKTFRKIQQQLM